MKKFFKILLPIILVVILIGLIVVISKDSNSTAQNSPKEVAKARKEIKVLNIIASVEPELKEDLQVTHEKLLVKKQEEAEAARIAEEERIAEEKRRAEEAEKNKIMTLNNKANNIASAYENTTRIEYGTSYQGRTLEAYLIKGNGANSKTIFMEFEVHGFEDEYAKDGKVLVNLGNDIVEYYAMNSQNLGDYQMIVVPSANPDGVIEGVNNTRVGNGYCFGRCTAAGYDMNRDFRAGYFQAQETQSLKALMNQYPMNIHLDFHGWENSVIGDQTIVNTFLTECGLAYNKGGRWGNGQGYVIEYTKNTFGAHSAIVEFRNSGSVSSSQVESALNKIMQQL